MNLQPEDTITVIAVLELHARKQTEAVKQAIREYNKTLRVEPSCDRALHLERKREVERAVSQYMQIRKRLDLLQTQTMSASADACKQRKPAILSSR